MTVKFVDLGYQNPIYVQLNGDTLDVASEDAYAVDRRARIVAAGKLDDTNDWGVSAVGKWAGSSGRVGYGIRVEHRDGAGVATGRVWFVAWGGRSGTLNAAAVKNQVFQNATQTNLHYESADSSNIVAAGFISMHMIDNYPGGGAVGGVDDYNWDVTVDLDVPTNTPHADLAAFMPNGALRGGVISGLQGSTVRHRVVLVADHATEYLGIEVNDDSVLDISFLFQGPFALNTDAGDTNTSVSFGGKATFPSVTSNHLQAFDDAGVAQDFDLDIPTFIGMSNELTGGEVQVQPMSVYNTAYVKGTLNPDIFPVAFAGNCGIGRLVTIPGGVAHKIGYYCLPWASGIAIPFAGWPLTPQTIPS